MKQFGLTLHAGSGTLINGTSKSSDFSMIASVDLPLFVLGSTLSCVFAAGICHNSRNILNYNIVPLN